MPTVWDETKVLEGKIGEYATIARKSGSDWFLGSLTGKKVKTVRLNLDFLDKNSDYEATIYSYDSGSESSTNVKIEKREVNAGSFLNFEITGNSGLAVHFRRI